MVTWRIPFFLPVSGSIGRQKSGTLLSCQVLHRHHSILDHCIVDEDCVIGNQCYVGLGANFDPDRTSITVLGKGVTIPAGMSIGRNCRIYPYTGIGDFPTKVVPAGMTINPRVKSLNAVL
jgi:UDP-3-O-[3-hydroxymyristoyl] glucosamine N-acyltransferase